MTEIDFGQSTLTDELFDLNQKFSVLLENINGGVIIENDNRRIAFVNKQFCKILDIRQTPEEMIGLDCKQLADNTAEYLLDPQSFLEEVEHTIENAEPIYSVKLPLKNGKVYERDYIPIKNNGICKTHIWIYRDITTFINIQRDLHYRLEFEQLLNELSTHFIVTTNDDLNLLINTSLKLIGEFLKVDRCYITQFNPKHKELSNRFEWCADGIEPKFSAVQNLPAEGFSWFMNQINNNHNVILNSIDDIPAEALNEREFYINMGIKSSLVVPLIYNLELQGFVGIDSLTKFINWDDSHITLFRMYGNMLSGTFKRKEIKDNLLASEQKYKSVIDNIKEVIFQTDAEGNWTFLNKAWEEISGFTVEESLGKLFLNYVHPDDRDRNAAYFEPLINRQKKYCRHTIRYITKDNNFRWIEVFARLTLDEKDNIIGTSGTLNDVTKRVLAEEETKIALEREKELNDMKSKFVSTISHEFRTPLTSILASSELLQRYFNKWDDTKKLNTLKRIENSVEAMNEMINDVLSLNRAESSRMIFNPTNLNLIYIAKNIVDEIENISEDKHNLIIDFDPNCDNVFIDETLIRHIIGNLLSNAIKYSPNGGDIKFSIKKINGNIIIEVLDSGIGISESDLKNLFQPFYRGTNIGNISGTGLGLSILHRAVELHKGKIDVQSVEKEGTKFTITIPSK